MSQPAEPLVLSAPLPKRPARRGRAPASCDDFGGLDPPPDFQPMTYQDLPPPPPDEGFYEAQPYYAFARLGLRRSPRRPNITRNITTSKTMTGGICRPAAAGWRWRSARVDNWNSARGRRGRVPPSRTLPSQWDSARWPAAVPAAVARTAAVAAQRNPSAAASSSPGPCHRTPCWPRQTLATNWRASGVGHRNASRRKGAWCCDAAGRG